jgi:bidirectional [NiFe] hydrogenase diaphorase subunit
MPIQLKPPPLPSTDKRWRIVEATMRRHGWSGHALIESLHTAQESFGFLDDQALRYVAAGLRVPLSKVYGVATFYHFFTLKPQGEHSCVVCMGTACYIKGAPECLSAVEQKYDVKSGETTEDGKLSVLTARCVGSCGLAPVVVLDRDVVGRVDPESVLDRVGKLVAT